MNLTFSYFYSALFLSVVSSLKVTDVKNLPDEYKFKSKPGTSVVSSPAEKDSQQVDRRAVSGRGPTKGQEESAVHGPSYKFQGAKEISVEDSILLQKQQREHLQVRKNCSKTCAGRSGLYEKGGARSPVAFVHKYEIPCMFLAPVFF